MHFASKLVVSLAVIAMIGCTSAPIQDVSNAPVTNAAGKGLSAEQVRAAILRAGSALGWQIKDDGPGKLVGTLQLRSHTAVVDIPYSASDYSIKYKSSVNLQEKDGKIHKNYNGWIQNLTRGINAQLTGS